MILFGQPQGKGRPRFTRRNGFIATYTPKETTIYEKHIREEWKNQDNIYYDDLPLKIEIKAYFKIPKSFSNKKRTKAIRGELRPMTKPDIDNICKIVLDGLNGVAYKDDKQVLEISANKFYAEVPRIEVKIKELKY